MSAEAIKVRDVRFDLSAAPLRWHGGRAGVTAFFDALSACFPLGEQFFIRSVKRALPRISDPALQASIKGFAGQEAVHAREHGAYNRRLSAAGYDIAHMEREQQRRIDWIENDLGADAALGITAAMEHMTSILAAEVTKDESYFDGADLAMRDLWLWHAMEEAEHGDVAFDALKATRPGYFFRLRMMLLSTRILIEIVGCNLKIIMRKDGARGAWRDLLGWLLAKPGLGRRVIPAYLAWYRPGFHPSQTNARHNAERYRSYFDELARAAT